MCINYPTLSYNDILLIISEKYQPNKFYYLLKKFNEFKMNYMNNLKKQNINETYLDKIEIKGNKLLKSTHRFIDTDDNGHLNKILGTHKSMKNLSNKEFTQFFVDSTYKCVQNNIKNIKCLLLIIGYNSSNDSFELFCSVLLSNEDNETLFELYSYLKNMWNFKPSIITYDYALGNITNINNAYKEDGIIILLCLFHLVKAWRRKISKLEFGKKELITNTRIFILNLKL